MSSLRRPLGAGEVAGYLIFFAGILWGIWLAVSQHSQDPKELNLFIPLLAIWIVAGVTVAGVTYGFVLRFGQFVSRRPLADILGFLIFFAGVLLCYALVKSQDPRQPNVFILVQIIWITTGVSVLTHRFVRAYLLASAVSALAAMVVAWVSSLISYGYVTDMAVAGTLMFGFLAFLISLTVGLPFVIYRRSSGQR